jgi:hypothetical protein
MKNAKMLKQKNVVFLKKKFIGFLFGVIFLIPFQFFSQGNLIITVLNLSNDNPISGAKITISQGNFMLFGITNSEGTYESNFKINNKQNLIISHPNFYSFERQFEMEEDTLFLSIRLRPEKVQEIKEIVIKAPGAVDTVFSSSRLHVEDFAVLPNGNLMLLTYSKRLKKGSEILLYDGQSIINSFAVPGIAEKLVQDYRGNIHVICKDRVLTILVNGNNLKLAQLEKDYFYRYVAPILDTNGQSLYYSDFNKDYPEFSYWEYDQKDSLYDKFRTIRDDLMMELYLSEYKWVDVRTKLWAKNLEFETGIDAEIWVGANYFTQSIYYRELFAPFFKVNSELLVFDYYRNKLYAHDASGLGLESVEIDHHLDKKNSGWKAELMQDQKNDKVYTWYEKAGTSFLGKIDTKTGEVNTKYQLNFKYLEKIQVYDNFAYYVYRPFETAQKKYLYKEKLPDEFTQRNQNSTVKETGK